jgi:hypothetical protein
MVAMMTFGALTGLVAGASMALRREDRAAEARARDLGALGAAADLIADDLREGTFLEARWSLAGGRLLRGGHEVVRDVGEWRIVPEGDGYRVRLGVLAGDAVRRPLGAQRVEFVVRPRARGRT